VSLLDAIGLTVALALMVYLGYALVRGEEL
jgi:hypothetical protein